jgi:hypothetical protein
MRALRAGRQLGEPDVVVGLLVGVGVGRARDQIAQHRGLLEVDLAEQGLDDEQVIGGRRRGSGLPPRRRPGALGQRDLGARRGLVGLVGMTAGTGDPPRPAEPDERADHQRDNRRRDDRTTSNHGDLPGRGEAGS